MSRSRPRSQPTWPRLLKHWYEVAKTEYETTGEVPVYLGELFIYGPHDVVACFRCNMGYRRSLRHPVWDGLQQAHLKNHAFAVEDGDPQDGDTPDNIVPLCERCHRTMPSFQYREEALLWLTFQVDPIERSKAILGLRPEMTEDELRTLAALSRRLPA